MDFRDPTHTAGGIVLQGTKEEDPAQRCNEEILEALRKWCSRADLTEAQPEILRLDGTRSFTITYQGDAADYWPDEASNGIGEGLVRDFLFRDGVCDLRELEPRLYIARYKVQALSDTEYLLVCPYETASGNIAGVLVVCVNRYIKSDKSEAS